MSDDGGPAFPMPLAPHEQGQDPQPGMALRDYFAGQALPVMVNRMLCQQRSPFFWIWFRLRRAIGGRFPKPTQYNEHMDMDAAEWAYKYADAMLKKRGNP